MGRTCREIQTPAWVFLTCATGTLKGEVVAEGSREVLADSHTHMSLSLKWLTFLFPLSCCRMIKLYQCLVAQGCYTYIDGSSSRSSCVYSTALSYRRLNCSRAVTLKLYERGLNGRSPSVLSVSPLYLFQSCHPFSTKNLTTFAETKVLLLRSYCLITKVWIMESLELGISSQLVRLASGCSNRTPIVS